MGSDRDWRDRDQLRITPAGVDAYQRVFQNISRALSIANGPQPPLADGHVRIHMIDGATTLHDLRNGARALCQWADEGLDISAAELALGERTPSGWPAGHSWCLVSEPCTACLAVALATGRIKVHER